MTAGEGIRVKLKIEKYKIDVQSKECRVKIPASSIKYPE
jgi:hypothetical protein